jgi:L-ornithine Nalpha-acyltransferase
MSTEGAKLTVQLARTANQVAACMALRKARFGVGQDSFDSGAILVMITRACGTVECCYRLTVFPQPQQIAASYSAQFYDLSNLQKLTRPVVELGRFCMSQTGDQTRDQTGGQTGDAADILRLAFAMMARVVDDHGAHVLFGCASFAGAEVALHEPALAVLRQHGAPEDMKILRKSPKTIDFDNISTPATTQGLRQVPPLLRSYLALGGWVSDLAVQDFELDTLHVFTAVEIDKIPATRAMALRQLAQGLTL